MSGTRVLLVFAKTPKPGKVKTRLLASVPAEVAAALHEACIADTLGLARKMRGCDVLVYAAGGTSYFRKLVKRLGSGARLRVMSQRGEDIGARMENAFRTCFAAGYWGGVGIWTDEPWRGGGRGGRGVWGGRRREGGWWAGGGSGWYFLWVRR